MGYSDRGICGTVTGAYGYSDRGVCGIITGAYGLPF